MTSVDPQQSTCRFGFARGNITPPIGMYHRMWGAATHDRAAGIHRPLMASVLLFQQCGVGLSAETAQMLVVLDHCLFEEREVRSMQAAIRRETKIPAEAILVLCTHTHAAGLMSRERADLPGGDLIPSYLDDLRTRVACLAKEALANAEDATIVYGYGRCTLAANRDMWDADRGMWVCGFNPSVPADDTVLVARVTDRSDRTKASIVNYACHPTTLAWDNQLISPDYPGAMRELVERETGAPCVFLQGAAGDLGPREGFVGDVSVANRNGRQLAYAALETLSGLLPPDHCYKYSEPIVSGATLGLWRHERLSDTERIARERWKVTRKAIALPYRADLPSRDAVRVELERLQRAEEGARLAGDLAEASRNRALAERETRMLARLNRLPPGDYPYEIVTLRIGDAVWCAAQGEPYSQMQTELRCRFKGHPLVIATLANSWGASYLPPAELYGKGIYQESIAVLAAGCLEKVIETTTEMVTECLPDGA